jgi:hypothetical protein
VVGAYVSVADALQFEQKVKSPVISGLVYDKSADGFEALITLELRGYTTRLFPFPLAKVVLPAQ